MGFDVTPLKNYSSNVYNEFSISNAVKYGENLNKDAKYRKMNFNEQFNYVQKDPSASLLTKGSAYSAKFWTMI